MVVRLVTRDVGVGAPVVLLHAFPLTSAMWAEQRDELATSYRIITPDQRGWNASPLGDDEPSLDVVADDLAALLDDKGLDRVVLGGVSMGGYVAMAFLRRYAERVRALVLAGTKAGADSPAAVENRLRIAETVEREQTPRVVMAELVPNLVGATTRQERPLAYARVRTMAQNAQPTAVAWTQRAMAARPESFDLLGALDVPILILVGDEDTVTPYADAEAMAAAAPKALLTVLRGVGHLSPLEDGRQFNEAVRDFVDALP